MNENEKNIEKIANGIIKYLAFENNLEINKLNEITQNEEVDIAYMIQQFNYECYIMDKKHFEDFCLSVNFDKLEQILNPINNENKIKFKKELREYLDKSPQMQNWENIKIYSEEDELKDVVKNIKHYSFINKELLCDGMCIPMPNLEGKEIKISKDKNKISLLSVKNNFIITFNENNIKDYKNLYYVEEITKKIFVLLYYNEKKIQEKIKNEIKDVYNFEKYYLINTNWLDDYKEFFSYESVIKKIKKNLKDYSYEKIKIELNDIVKRKIGQIKLYNETKVPNDIRNVSKLESGSKRIKFIKDNNENKSFEYNGPSEEEQQNLPFFIPNEFELINEDIFELLMKEEFFYNMNDKIKKILSYEVLFGNNQIIIKNKLDEKFPNLYEYFYNYLIYVKNDDNNNDDKYILKYILNYENKYVFFKDFNKIIKEGLKKYMDSNEIKLSKKTNEQNIFDEKKNILGKFIDIKINPNDFKTIFIINNKNSLNDEDVKKSYTKKINEIKFSYINKNNNNDKICNEKLKKKKSKKLDKSEEKSIMHDKNNNKEDNNISLNCNESSLKKDENIKNNMIYKCDKYDFKTLQRKINIIEPFLNELFKELTKDKNSIINILAPKEIIEKKDSQGLKQIILIEENSFKIFKSLLKYDLIKQYLNSNEKEKNELLEKNKDFFSEFYNIIENPDDDISTKFSIIKDYNESLYNNQYFIIYKDKFQYLYKQSKEISIFYFIYDKNEYIFFENEQKILILNKMKDNDLYTVEKFEYDKLNILKQFKIQIESNKDIKNLDINKPEQKYNTKEYYLIDNKWVDMKISNYIMENMHKNKNKSSNNKTINTNNKPTSKNILNKYNYPTNFVFLEKNKYKDIILELAKKSDIKANSFLIYKVFFVHWQNNIPNQKQIDKLYLGILDNSNNKIIYFYLIDKGDYTFDFLIDLNVKNINEIINNIKIKGIGQFLYEMGVDTNLKEEDLFDSDLIKIGSFINFNNQLKKDICSREYAKSIKNSDYFCGILQCLANIIEFRDFFLNKKEIIKFNEKDYLFTKHFYRIIQDLWFGFDDKVNNDLNINFMEEIKKINSNNIFNNIKLLIDSLLLKIHNEIKTDKKGKIIKNIDTKLDEMYNEENQIIKFYENNNSIIQKLFFFEVELKSSCYFCQKDTLNCYLNYCSFELEIKQTKESKEQKNNKIQNILSYNLNEDTKCLVCSKSIKMKKQFKTLPKYLILIIKQSNVNDYKFKMNELILDIDINGYIIENKLKNKSKYELVSIMDNNLVTYCKSPINSKWYKYMGKDAVKEVIFNKIEKLMVAANLLIYKNK